MLSKANPITTLFETIDIQPLNYIQVLQDLMLQPSVPPEYEYPSVSQKSIMKLDLTKIDRNSIKTYRSAFHKLANFVVQGKTAVTFPGLDYALNTYTKTPCCSWSCLHESSPKPDLLQLLTAIRSQSKPSEQLYVIEVVDG